MREEDMEKIDEVFQLYKKGNGILAISEKTGLSYDDAKKLITEVFKKGKFVPGRTENQVHYYYLVDNLTIEQIVQKTGLTENSVKVYLVNLTKRSNYGTELKDTDKKIILEKLLNERKTMTQISKELNIPYFAVYRICQHFPKTSISENTASLIKDKALMGLTINEIATELKMSATTISTYIGKLVRKGELPINIPACEYYQNKEQNKEQNRKIVQDVLQGEKTQSEIAREYGISRQRVSQIKLEHNIPKKEVDVDLHYKIAIEFLRGAETSELVKKYKLSRGQILSIVHRLTPLKAGDIGATVSRVSPRTKEILEKLRYLPVCKVAEQMNVSQHLVGVKKAVEKKRQAKIQKYKKLRIDALRKLLKENNELRFHL